MPRASKKPRSKPALPNPSAETRSAVYRGKQARTGNSLALRFERALFRSHPEFSGDVEARVIGPGRMLVVARREAGKKNAEDDSVLSSFLSFLAADMQTSPGHISSLDRTAMDHIRSLTATTQTSPEEDLGDEAPL